MRRKVLEFLTSLFSSSTSKNTTVPQDQPDGQSSDSYPSQSGQDGRVRSPARVFVLRTMATMGPPAAAGSTHVTVNHQASPLGNGLPSVRRPLVSEVGADDRDTASCGACNGQAWRRPVDWHVISDLLGRRRVRRVRVVVEIGLSGLVLSSAFALAGITVRRGHQELGKHFCHLFSKLTH